MLYIEETGELSIVHTYTVLSRCAKASIQKFCLPLQQPVQWMTWRKLRKKSYYPDFPLDCPGGNDVQIIRDLLELSLCPERNLRIVHALVPL